MAKVMNSFLLLLTGLSFLERSFYLFTQLASFAVALHLSRRRTNTRTHTGTPLQAYAYALCQTKIVHEGRGESAAQFETQQSYAVWYDAECQTWETHRSRCTGVGFICCCFFYSIIFPPPSSSFSSSILPSLLSFHFFSSYIKKRRWVCHIPHVYGYI